MREEIGHCHICGKKIFCLNGFLDGITSSEGLLTCFSCEQLREREEKSTDEK